MKVLALLTDAFGGHGGIACYNRDFLTAICDYPATESVVAVARHAANPLEQLPASLDYTVAPSRSLVSFLGALFTKLWQEKPFDFVLCGHINLMPIAWLVSRWLRVPILLQIYGLEAWQPTSRYMANRLAKRAHMVTSISQFTRQRFLKWVSIPERDCVLVPNAIRTSDFGIRPPDLRVLERFSLDGRRSILTLGRLVSKERAKGFDEVLELMPELIRQVPDILYVIAGDGPDRARLERKADGLGIQDHVVFTGLIEEEEKADLYQAAKVYVMPSKGEGFGFVFLEAMACGTPVIASSQDGSREAVADGELGQVVNPDEPEEILSAILRSLRMPKQVPPGLDRFSFENFTGRVFGVLDRMTAHG